MKITAEQSKDSNLLWELPPRLPVFTGREDHLKSLKESFFGSGSQTVIIHQAQRISGSGGIGKTQLAIECAHRMYEAESVSNVFWLNADCSTGDQLATGFRRLAILFNIPIENPDTSVIVKQVYHRISKLKKTLIILDNATSYLHLKPYLPQGHDHISLLVTTRDGSDWASNFCHLALGIFSSDEAISFLKKSIPEHLFQHEAAVNLANTLGYFPLALAQAAGYIQTRNISVVQYLDLFTAAHKKQLLDKPVIKSDPHQETLWITINLCLEQVENEAVKDLLFHCAYLAAESPIECQLLQNVGKLPTVSINDLNQLLTFGLANLTGQVDQIKLHQMVQEILRLTVSQDKFISMVTQLPKQLFLYCGEDVDLRELKRRSPMLIPHLLSVLTHSRELQRITQIDVEHNIALLDYNLGRLYGSNGLFFQQIEHMQAARVYYAQKAPDDETYPRLLCGLGGGYISVKQLKVAYDILSEVNDIINKTPSITPITRIWLWMNTGLLFNTLKSPKIALEIQQKAYSLAEDCNLFCESKPLKAQLLDNIGQSYRLLNQFDLALDNHQRALTLFRKLYGEKDQAVLCSLNNIASLYIHSHEFQKSLLVAKQAVDLVRQLYPDEHLTTAQTIDNYGISLAGCDRYDEALDCHLEAEDTLIKLMGEDYFPLSVTYGAIATCLLAKNNHIKSREYILKAKDLVRRNLGVKNMYYAQMLIKESATYRREDKVEASDKHYYRELLTEALILLKELIGSENHLEIATALHQLAISYINPQEVRTAIGYLFQALKIIVGLTNAESRVSFPTRFRLACILPMDKQYAEAHKQFLVCKRLCQLYPDFAVCYGSHVEQSILMLSNVHKMPFFQAPVQDEEVASEDTFIIDEILAGRIEFTADTALMAAECCLNFYRADIALLLLNTASLLEDSPEKLRVESLCYCQLGDTDTAQEKITALLEKEPNNQQGLSLRGKIAATVESGEEMFGNRTENSAALNKKFDRLIEILEAKKGAQNIY